jgi:hypothetical protein
MFQSVDIQYIKDEHIAHVRIRYNFCTITDADVNIAVRCTITCNHLNESAGKSPLTF